MYGFEAEEAVFYAASWLVAFVATFARTVRDGEYGNWWHCVSVAVTSGFLAFGAIAFLVTRDTGGDRHPWYYLGLAALIGLMAKEQDAFGRAVLAKVFGTTTTTKKENEKDE